MLNLVQYPLNILKRVQNNKNVHGLRILLWFSFGFLLSSQLGKHFFLPFSYINGVRVDYLAPTVYISDLIVFILILFHIKSYQSALRYPTSALLLFLLAIQTIWSVGLEISLYKFLKIVECIAIIGILAQNTYSYASLFLGLTMGAFLQLLLVASQLSAGASIQGVWYLLGERYLTLSMPGVAKATLAGREILRPYGTFSHPNSMGGFYLLIYSYTLTTKHVRKVLVVLSSILALLSLSKLAIGAWVFITLWFLFKKFSHKKKGLFLFPLLLICALIPLIISFFATTDRLTLSNRLILAKESLEVIRSYPLTGVGIGAYVYASAHFAQRTPYFLNQPVHNIFLLIIAELGIPLILCIAYILMKQIKKFNIPNTAVFLFLGTVFFTGFFDHYWWTLQQNFLILATLTGIITGETIEKES